MPETLQVEKLFPEAALGGPAEVGTAYFRLPPVLPSGWASRFVAELAGRVPQHGGAPIRIRIWANTDPIFWTNYKVELVLREKAVAQAGYAGMAAPFPWVLLGVIVVLGLSIILVWAVSKMDWKPLAPIAVAAVGVAILAIVGLWIAGRRR